MHLPVLSMNPFKLARSSLANALRNSLSASSKRYVSETVATGNGPWYDLNEDQRNIVDLAEKFVREEIIPKAAHHDKTGEYPMDIVKKAWELGFVTNR